MLDRIAARHPHQPAVISRHQGIQHTYVELRNEVARVARGLMAIGVEHGDRIGIWSPNCAEWLVAAYAAAKAGAVLVHLNAACSSSELEQVIDHSGASVLVTAARSQTTDYLAMLRPLTLPSVRHVVCLGSEAVPGHRTWGDLCATGDAVPEDLLRAREASVRFDDAASIMYTSGTTGRAKGATLSHHSLLNNAFFIGERLRYDERDRVCLPVPLYHTFGYMLGALAALTHGSAIVLPGVLFDVNACLDSIEQYGCTAFYGVPSMFSGVLRHPQFAADRVRTLRTGIMAGAPCPSELMRQVMSDMHVPEVAICYGLTEAGTLCQSLPGDTVEQRVSTVGAVHPHVECKVVDPATRRTLPRGVAGEVWARGYCVMSGYWRDEDASREIMPGGGWICTGDLAIMRDDGYLQIVGRLKDVVISAGRNIHTREIEDVIRMHPKVREVAVIGIPDGIYGEAACAWIQVADAETLTAEDIQHFCRSRLARYQVPRRVRFTGHLPLTPSGKVQKFRLRELSIQEFGLSHADGAETA
jgi:fatty-acyl-CoA synthase